MWRARRDTIALAARCAARYAQERGISASSSSLARWSTGKKGGKHRRGAPTTDTNHPGGGPMASAASTQFELDAHALASGDGVVFFKDEVTQLTQGAVDVSVPGRNDAYYNAPADYAGVSIRSTLTWPMPMDEIAVLNPKLALAMGQSRSQVATANKGREALNPVGGRPNARAAAYASKTMNDPNAPIDPSTMDPDELAIVQMLEEDKLEARRKDAFALMEARERRRLQTERENAPKEDRRVRTVDTREIAEKAQSERGRVDRKLAALERKKEELRLADVWESSKAAGEVHKILPKPGSIPGATPAVYEHLKRHMLDKSNEKLAAKQTNAALTESALGRLNVKDLRRACEIVGLPTTGLKKTLTQMLHAHFKDAEHHFARAFIAAQTDLDRKVKKLKKEAAGHARAIVEEERLERAAIEKKARGTSTDGEVRGRGRPPKPETEEARRRRAARAAAAAESLGQALGTVDFRDEDSEYEYEEGDDEEGAEVGAEDAFDAITASEMQEESDETTPDPRTGRMNYVEAFDPEELATILLKAKGADVVVIPVKEKCNWSDHFVVCTAKSPRHIRMLAGAVLHAVKKRTKFVAGNKLQPGIEGADAADGETPGDDHWMLVDCGSCVVHVFSPDARRRFDLEGLWAPGVPLERRNANDGGALTIDTITADEGDEVADEDDVEIEIDLDDMPGTLDDYEDAYVDPPSWERSITDVEQERVRARGKRRGDTGGFGKAGVNLD